MIIGIVGKPSAGKSTFFKAATLSEVEIADYPFTTIKPNHAVGFVKVEDPAVEFGKASQPRMGYVLDGWRFIPVDMIDVAGRMCSYTWLTSQGAPMRKESVFPQDRTIR